MLSIIKQPQTQVVGQLVLSHAPLAETSANLLATVFIVLC